MSLAHVAHICLNQMSLKAGLKKHPVLGKKAMIKEMTQLQDTGTMEPMHPSQMTSEQKREALMALANLKEKRDGSIKGRTCVDGRPQRKHAVSGEASSPTVALESVLLTCVIDAHEGRDVAITDIPGAYLSCDLDELVHMRLTGALAEYMVMIAPEIYSEYVHVDKNNKKVLYVRLKKALYGLLRSALLFYRKLSKVLDDEGFVKNNYDSCVDNK